MKRLTTRIGEVTILDLPLPRLGGDRGTLRFRECWSFVGFRFLAGTGIGGEYAAITRRSTS